MSDKENELKKEILNYPECIACFQNITDHANGVYGTFEVQSNEHFEKWTARYADFEKKMYGLLWRFLVFFGSVALVCSGIVGVTWVSVQNKADEKDVFMLKDAKKLEGLRSSYYDSRYVAKPDQRVDETTYEWWVEFLFEPNSRSAEKVNQESKN